jgi:hypothetical protein
MLKSLIGKAFRVVDDAGVETVLTLAFVAQFAAYSLPFGGVDAVRVSWVSTESDVVEVGTVVQMPAKPKGRMTKTVVVREGDGARSSASVLAAPRPPGVRRPEPVEEELGGEEPDQRAMESSVRVTIIGPDGQPRTKVVRLSGSRDGTTAPARRPHD